MKAVSCAILALGLLLSCASTSSEAPRAGVERMLKLYSEDRPRFVRHLQEMEQNKSDCNHVGELHREAEKMDYDGSLPKDQQQNLVVVKMELAEAEKICRK